MTLGGENFWSVDLTLVIDLHKKESQFGKIPNEKYFLYNVISFELSNFIFQFLTGQKLLKFLPGLTNFRGTRPGAVLQNPVYYLTFSQVLFNGNVSAYVY